MKKGLFWVAGCVVVALLLWIGALGPVATRMESRAKGKWRVAGMPLEEVTRRHPKSAADAATLRLEGLAAELGIDLAPRDAPGRSRPTRESRMRFAAVRGPLADHLAAEIEKPTGSIAAPSPEIAEWLDANAVAISALENHLVSPSIPRWETDAAKGISAPIPNLLGQIEASRLLVVLALERERNGDTSAALRALEAEWNLGLSLRERPEMISQSNWIATMHNVIGALRRIDGATPEWVERLRDSGVPLPFRYSLEFEAWSASEAARAGTSPTGEAAGAGEGESWLVTTRLGGLLEKSYLRAASAEYLEAMLEMVEAGVASDPCDDDLEKRLEPALAKISRWNAIGRILIPDLSKSWQRLHRWRLDAELTRHVLEARLLRRATPNGAWPSRLPGLEKSPCAGQKWIWVLDPDGRGTLTFSRPVVGKEPFGSKLPFEWRTPAP